MVAGLEDGEWIAERPDATPNPAVEVRESLPSGTEFKAVGSHLRQRGVAKLVTVHFFDRGCRLREDKGVAAELCRWADLLAAALLAFDPSPPGGFDRLSNDALED